MYSGNILKVYICKHYINLNHVLDNNASKNVFKLHKIGVIIKQKQQQKKLGHWLARIHATSSNHGEGERAS